MNRYIDAENVKSYIFGQFVDRFPQFTLNAIIEGVDDIEPADVAPVVHAKWTRKRTQMHDGELYCSNCEWSPEVLGGTTLGDLQLADVYFCPHCGAKMDGKEGKE